MGMQRPPAILAAAGRSTLCGSDHETNVGMAACTLSCPNDRAADTRNSSALRDGGSGRKDKWLRVLKGEV